MLHSLVKLNEPRVTRRVRELICLIPSDRTISEALDSLEGSVSGTTSKSNSLERLKKVAGGGQKGNSTSPKLRIRHSNSATIAPASAAMTSTGGSIFNSAADDKKPGASVVRNLFELNPTGNLTPFQLLYNIEVCNCMTFQEYSENLSFLLHFFRC